MRSLIRYLNPVAGLGVRKYAIIFPFVCTFSLCILSEVYDYDIAKDPMIIGVYGIFLFVALIIYFAFRDGIQGGLITTSITILYYVYVIYTRHYKGQQLTAGIDATILLAIFYFILSGIIGGLKQTIDTLIEREADEKNRLHTILQQLPVGILITDSKGKLVQINKQLYSILGKERTRRLHMHMGEDIHNSKNDQDKDGNPKHWPIVQSLSTGKPVMGKEFVIDREDGKKVYLDISASPIHNRRGHVIATASIINDVTQQREMEERKDDFVNMASHELKTPITSMKLYIELLMHRIKKYDDEKAMKALQSIKYQTERLQALVSDLLDVSRLQTGKLSFTKEKFDLDELIKETVENLQGLNKKQKLLYTGKVSIFVNADRFRIYQVLTNLITNAVKYSFDETTITIRVKKTTDKIVVSVQDFGIGIQKEQQKKIFERLYQVSDPKEQTFPGFGMGLYISKEIIKRHRGTIWVESTKGKGSTFYFSLPLKR